MNGGRKNLLLTIALFLAICLALAFLLRGLRFDDPFITYRFAENLAAGRGFLFNPRDAHPALITTTPLYAMVLAFTKLLGFDIPSVSHWIGAGSLLAAALALAWHSNNSSGVRPAGLAGLCLLMFPLLWLTIGFETPLFIAVSLWAFVCVQRRQRILAGVLSGIALGLRGDGIIVLGIVGAASILLDERNWRQRWRSLFPILVPTLLLYAPLAVWLTLQFGSPIPSTLQTKSAQAVSGLTGFYTSTRFPEGAWILTLAYIQQGGLFLVTLAAMLIGIGVLIQRWRTHVNFLLPVAWLIAHFVGYSLISVAPYVWYYAPMVPGVCALLGLGLAWLVQRLQMGMATPIAQRVGRTWAGVLVIAVLGSLLMGDVFIARIVTGGVPPPPTVIDSKVLPETKVDVYERVGRWIAANTPITATLGVTELGVMSYYAQRYTIDFLGLTQPAHIANIRHGDFLAGLLREQPDFVALSNINAIYDVNPQRDGWFTQIYTPVVTFEDARFWGSPVTVWQRTRAPIIATHMLFSGHADLGEGWQILQVESSTRQADRRDPILLRLRLKAGQAIGNRTLRVQPIVLEGGDGLPVSSRIIFTNRWRNNETDWLDITLLPQPNPREGAYAIEVGWQEGGPTARVGLLKVQPNVNDAPDIASVILLNQATQIGILPIDTDSVCAGSTPNLLLIWRGGNTANRDYTVFLHLRDASNNTVAQGDGAPRNGGFLYPTSVWEVERIADTHAVPLGMNVLPGTYAIVAGLYDPISNERLLIDPSPYRTPDGGVKIGELVVKSCN